MLQQKSRDMIIRAMGPDLCIRLELETQGKSVISPRPVSLSTVSWNLAGAVRRFLGTTRSDFNRQFDEYIRKAFGNDAFRNTVLIGDAISSKIGDGTAGNHFRKGDLVETLCCNPQNPKCHFPFLLQTNLSKKLGFLADTRPSTIWYVRPFLQITDNDWNTLPRGARFYVALQACILQNDSVPVQCFKKYRVDTKGQISFAQLDSSMRKVGVIRTHHVGCDPDTAVDVNCTDTVEDVVLVITRDGVYPPRQG